MLTLNEDFAKEIPTGMHLFGIISKDGVAITTFTVDDKAEDNDTKSPQTGENNHMALWIAFLLAGGGLLTVTGVYGKSLLNKALCLPQTIGSTTGGLVLYCACSMEKNPACMLFANHIDSLAAAGAVLADVWVDKVTMPVVDSLGDEFLNYVKDGMKITVNADGVVEVEDN